MGRHRYIPRAKRSGWEGLDPEAKRSLTADLFRGGRDDGAVSPMDDELRDLGTAAANALTPLAAELRARGYQEFVINVLGGRFVWKPPASIDD